MLDPESRRRTAIRAGTSFPMAIPMRSSYSIQKEACARMGWKILDHTADMGIRVDAPDLPLLFREAACALVHFTGAGSPDREETFEVAASGIDREDLLVRWLQELLYLVMVKDVRVSGIEVDRLTETDVHVRMQGARRKGGLQREVKAVTYHGLRIARQGDSWEASIIVDL
jgi:SHS2 domain-containing protein